MEQYINKSAVIEEIEKRLSLLENGTGDSEVMKRVEGVIKGYKSILSFLDTLEVKEVDEEYNGKAMLHVLEKGVKTRQERELINKACEWLKENAYFYVNDFTGNLNDDMLVSEFHKAMEE